jgi:hypothetical protein
LRLALLGALAVLTMLVQAAPTSAAPRLAVLIALPWPGETAMSRDVAAAQTALQRRGFTRSEVIVLDGDRSRDAVLGCLGGVRQRIRGWREGDLFILVSGHGTYKGTTVADARPGLLLSGRYPPPPELAVYWDEIFLALDVPAGVRAILVPDT